MDEANSNTYPCLGHVDGKQCHKNIDSDTNFCTNCGTKNPGFLAVVAQSTKEYDAKESFCSDMTDEEIQNDKWNPNEKRRITASCSVSNAQSTKEYDAKESFCSDMTDEEIQNDKWNPNEKRRITASCSVSNVHSTNENRDQDTGECSFSDRSDDDDQDDKWNPCVQLVAMSVSDDVEVSSAEEIPTEGAGSITNVLIPDKKEPNEVEMSEEHSRKNKPLSDLEAGILEDEILTDIGLDDVKKEILQMLTTNGPRATMQFLNDNASSWRSATVKIAVAGKSSVGKSAFINAIRDVKRTDEGSAKEGRGDTTLAVQEYRHPRNKKILYCDLPGYGTVIMTKEKFLKNVNLLDYDIYLIFVDPVPTEDDQWLIEQLRKDDKEYCFVRAKLDRDMKNIKDMGIAEENVLAEIRKPILDAAKNMPTIKEDLNIFLISNKNLSIGEMGNLVSFIEAKIPMLKFEAILFCLSAFNKEVIENKYQMLHKRISSLSFSIVMADDAVIIWLLARAEILLYYEVFILDVLIDRQPPDLKHPFSADCVKMHLNRLFEVIPGILKRIVPIYGMISFYRAVKGFFKQLLDELKDDCITFHRFEMSENKTRRSTEIQKEMTSD